MILISPKCLKWIVSSSIDVFSWGSKENVIFVSEVDIRSTESLWSLNKVNSSARMPGRLHISSLVRLTTVTSFFIPKALTIPSLAIFWEPILVPSPFQDGENGFMEMEIFSFLRIFKTFGEMNWDVTSDISIASS